MFGNQIVHKGNIMLTCSMSYTKKSPKGTLSLGFFSPSELLFSDAICNGAKIQLINESEEKIENLFYYVDYEVYDSKEQIPDDLGRFHATWNRENPCEKVVYNSDIENPAPWDLPGKNTTGDENYVILNAEGKGHYVGCVLNIDNFDASNQEYTWPGEGDDMFFIDGEECTIPS